MLLSLLLLLDESHSLSLDTVKLVLKVLGALLLDLSFVDLVSDDLNFVTASLSLVVDDSGVSSSLANLSLGTVLLVLPVRNLLVAMVNLLLANMDLSFVVLLDSLLCDLLVVAVMVLMVMLVTMVVLVMFVSMVMLVMMMVLMTMMVLVVLMGVVVLLHTHNLSLLSLEVLDPLLRSLDDLLASLDLCLVLCDLSLVQSSFLL